MDITVHLFFGNRRKSIILFFSFLYIFSQVKYDAKLFAIVLNTISY